MLCATRHCVFLFGFVADMASVVQYTLTLNIQPGWRNNMHPLGGIPYSSHLRSALPVTYGSVGNFF